MSRVVVIGAGGVPALVLQHAEATRQHTFRSITASIDRARQVLGYAPRFTSLGALHEALTWLAANGQADVGGQTLPAVAPG